MSKIVNPIPQYLSFRQKSGPFSCSFSGNSNQVPVSIVFDFQFFFQKSARSRSSGRLRSVCLQLSGDAGIGHAADVQHLLQLSGSQQMLLLDQLSDGHAGGQGLLGQGGRSGIADVGAEGGDDAHAGLQQLLAAVHVGHDALDAIGGEGLHRAGQLVDGLEEAAEDHRLEGVQLHLARLHGHGNGDVVARDAEGHLVQQLRDHGVHLAGHDGGTVLPGGQADLSEAGTGAGGHEPQIVGDLGQGDGTVPHCRGHGGEAVHVLGGVDQIRGLPELRVHVGGQGLGDVAEVGAVGVEAGADGGAAHVDGQQLMAGVGHPAEAPADGGGIGLELLAQPDRHGVLQLGAAHFQNVVELLCLQVQSPHQGGQRLFQTAQQHQSGHLTGGGDHVVGGLAAVHMVVGVDQGVVSQLAPQMDDGHVGNDLVGVHIHRGACTALHGVHDELIVVPPCGDLVAGPGDGVCPLPVQHLRLRVGDGTGLLHNCQAADHLRVEMGAGNGEVFQGPQGLDPVVSVGGDHLFTDGVPLDACFYHVSCSLCLRSADDRRNFSHLGAVLSFSY